MKQIKIPKAGFLFFLMILLTFGTAFAKPLIFSWIYPKNVEDVTTGFIIKTTESNKTVFIGVDPTQRRVEVETPILPGPNKFTIQAYDIVGAEGFKKKRLFPNPTETKVVLELKKVKKFTINIKDSAIVK